MGVCKRTKPGVELTPDLKPHCLPPSVIYPPASKIWIWISNLNPSLLPVSFHHLEKAINRCGVVQGLDPPWQVTRSPFEVGAIKSPANLRAKGILTLAMTKTNKKLKGGKMKWRKCHDISGFWSESRMKRDASEISIHLFYFAIHPCSLPNIGRTLTEIQIFKYEATLPFRW